MYELTIPLQEGSQIPMYEQIYAYIKEEIKNGNISPRTKLPSTRNLAGSLGVSRSTTQLAYDQLISEGYLTAEPCRGYFAAELDGLVVLDRTDKVAEKPGEAEEQEKYVCDFSLRGIDLASFPYHTWKRLSKETLIGENKEIFALGDPQGEEELRSAIRSYLYSARGVNCRTEQIIVGAGNEYLLMLLNQLIGNDNVIAMENPTYRQAYRVFSRLGHRVCPVSMDESGICMKELEASQADVVYVMPSHQFPTGVIMPIKRRMELLSWAAKGISRYIIEDDYDSEFRYRGKPIPSLQGYDHCEKVIYIGTFSRAIAPAIRISYLVLPDRLLDIYRRTCSFYASTVSRIDQSVLAHFISDGYYERHLNKMRALYRTRHDLLLECLKKLEAGFEISGANAGMHLLLTSKKGCPEQELIAQAKAYRVKIYGMSGYYIDEVPDSRTVALGFANLSEEKIKMGTEQLYQAWMT